MSEYRYEIKFSLDDVNYAKAMKWLFVNTHAVKKFDNRYVSSLYFDDPGYSSIRDNITGLSDRSKYRLRWYDKGTESSCAISPRFEVKIKKGRLGKKDSVNLTNLKDNFTTLPLHQTENDVRHELRSSNILLDDYYTSVLHVRYLREYYEDNLGLRITFDSEIQFSYVDGLTLVLSNCPKLHYRRKIMEFKFNVELKDHVSELMRSLNMSPTRHSKYLMGLSKFGSILYI